MKYRWGLYWYKGYAITAIDFADQQFLFDNNDRLKESLCRIILNRFVEKHQTDLVLMIIANFHGMMKFYGTDKAEWLTANMSSWNTNDIDWTEDFLEI